MKKQRLIPLIAILVLILTAAGPAAASDDNPAPQWPSGSPALFLPVVVRAAPTYALSGQVKDAEDIPLAGVTVEVDGGQAAVTDVNGVYSLNAPEGEQTIEASKEGYVFEPGTAELDVSTAMHNLNFSALSSSLPNATSCTNLLINSDFELATGWVIRDPYLNGKNKSRYTTSQWFSPVSSMLSGAPIELANPYPGEWTTGEFYQTTVVSIPLNATVVQVRMRLLPRSTDLWGYHVAEQAKMDAMNQQSVPDTATLASMPEAWESQYGFVCLDGSDTDSCNPDNGGKMLFKWFPINSYWWLYRAYDLMQFRGDSVSMLFGAANDGYNGNTALYVDDVYLYYCTP